MSMNSDQVLTSEQRQTIPFNRLSLAIAANTKPAILHIPHSEHFSGEIIHSQQLKNPSRFSGKSVIVVESGQTAADTLEFLRVEGVKKLDMSHRRESGLVGR